jgi:RNA polymerase sigma factor (sigma-70 family)
VKPRRDELTDEQWKAVEEAGPEIHKLALKLLPKCPQRWRKSVEDLEALMRDLFAGRARRWDPTKGKLFPFAREAVSMDVIRTVWRGFDPALDNRLRAMDAQEKAIVAPDTATSWAEALEDKDARARALGRNQALAAVLGDDSTAGARSPEDEYGGRELVAAMKREASSVDPRAADIMVMRYEQDLALEEVSARLGLDKRQVQRIEEKAFKRLREVFGPRENLAP